MKEINFWNFVYQNLKQNNEIALTIVADHKKGSPGKQGFKMAVSSNGSYAGSIGGGVMEYNAIAGSKELLKKNVKTNKIETLFHNRRSLDNVFEMETNRSGLICSGSQINFTLTVTKKYIITVRKILDSLRTFKSEKIIFNPKGFSLAHAGSTDPEFRFKYMSDKNWSFEQAIAKRSVVYVIGAGHVGLAVCKIFSLLDFHIVVFDSRKNLLMEDDNNFADEVIIDSFENLGNIILENSYVLIVTTGFVSDKEALLQVVDKKVRYIGLMGTKAKIKKIFSEAIKAGIKKESLGKIHAPVGIDINSDTPEEIAISIAAEIIKEKNKLA